MVWTFRSGTQPSSKILLARGLGVRHNKFYNIFYNVANNLADRVTRKHMSFLRVIIFSSSIFEINYDTIYICRHICRPYIYIPIRTEFCSSLQAWNGRYLPFGSLISNYSRILARTSTSGSPWALAPHRNQLQHNNVYIKFISGSSWFMLSSANI